MMMKLGIPTNGKGGLNEMIEPHFGKAMTYTIVDTVSGEVVVIGNDSDHYGGTLNPPELLQKAGVETVITANLGRKAVAMLNQLGMAVYSGAQGTVDDALLAFKMGYLQPADDQTSCSH
jgi:predicted Fe-Mo cluster-binding NifX family protein